MRYFARGKLARCCVWAVICLFSISNIHCATSNNGGSNDDFTIPEDFNTLMLTLNSQASDANQKAFAFAQAYQGFFGVDLDTLSATQLQTVVLAFVLSGENLVFAMNFYGALRDAYTDRLGSNLSLGKFQSAGVDTLSGDISGVVQSTKEGEAKCAEDAGFGTDNENFQIYSDCIKKLRAEKLGQVANIGVGAFLGSGVGAIAGLLAGATGSSLLVPVAAGLAAGTVAGIVWNWCTSGSSNFKLQDLSGQACVFVACEQSVKKLPDGRNAIACSVPPGSGTVTIFTEEGVPVVRNVTITDDGKVIDTTDCDAQASSATPAQASACESGAVITDGADLSGSCSDILTFNANANPPDPGAGQSVVITYSVFPKASGCPTAYTVLGTDGYSAAGSPTTDSNGAASFTIPGGASGVVDTVNVMENTNGNSREIVYIF